MDIRALLVELKIVGLPKYCRSSSFETEKVWPVLCSKALLAAKIGIGGDRRKSIKRIDWIYRSG
jgi:hypothetical protein